LQDAISSCDPAIHGDRFFSEYIKATVARTVLHDLTSLGPLMDYHIGTIDVRTQFVPSVTNGTSSEPSLFYRLLLLRFAPNIFSFIRDFLKKKHSGSTSSLNINVVEFCKCVDYVFMQLSARTEFLPGSHIQEDILPATWFLALFQKQLISTQRDFINPLLQQLLTKTHHVVEILKFPGHSSPRLRSDERLSCLKLL
jgi:hypothetical protein